MRPRRDRLGWRGERRPGERCRPRFNEAEAGTPRMADRGRAARRGSRRCFNEAEAGTPRMAGAGGAHLASGELASMRPRRERLGWAGFTTENRNGKVASMRPRRERLGWRHIICLWPRRQSRRSFERSRAGLGENRHGLRVDPFTMSKSEGIAMCCRDSNEVRDFATTGPLETGRRSWPPTGASSAISHDAGLGTR